MYSLDNQSRLARRKPLSDFIRQRLFPRSTKAFFIDLLFEAKTSLYIFFETFHTSGKLLSKTKDTDVVLFFYCSGRKNGNFYVNLPVLVFKDK